MLGFFLVLALLINYFFGWRKYKPEFDQKIRQFKASLQNLNGAPEAIDYLRDLEPEALKYAKLDKTN